MQVSGAPWLQGNNQTESLNLSGMPPEDAIRLQKLSRKQQLANILLQKALQGQQGGMAGKFYVAPSWTQGLTQLAEAGLGTVMNKGIDDERALMAQEIERRRQGEIDAYQQATSPKAVQPQMPVDSTLVPPTFDIEQLQPDAQRAAQRDANTTAYANTAAPAEIASGALTDNINKIGATVPDPQMSASPATIPVGPEVLQAPDPIKARQATMQAMMSQDPRVAQAVRFMEQQKAAEEEKATQRTFMADQKAEDRAVRREGIAQQAQTALAQIQGNMLMRQGMIDQSDKNSERHAELMRQQQADKIEADKWKAKLEAETRRQHDETLKTIAAGHDAAKREGDQLKAGSKGKVPASIGQKFMENSQNLRMAENALDLIGKNKDATGLKGYLPDSVLQRVDPAGVDTRAAIANLGSMVIHDRSGAAVTASEYPRLRPFIPSEKDDAETVKKKLTQFAAEYKKINQEMTDFYRESGYDIPENWHQAGGSASQEVAPQSAPTATGPGGQKLILKDGQWQPLK
jgi:hypothetical protein